MKKYLLKDIQDVEKQETLVQELKEKKDPMYKEQKERLKQMKKALDYHQFITFWEPDEYVYQETWPDRQVNFQTEMSFRKQLAIDYFITQYPTEWLKYTEDSFKQGVDLYSKYKDDILPLMQNFSETGNKKSLKKEMKKIFKKVEKETGIKNKDWK